MHTTTAAPQLAAGHIFGTLGVGGAALAVTIVLILGIRGRGEHRWNHQQAGVLGFIAGTLYVSAGELWANAGTLTEGITGVVTAKGGLFGGAGEGAVAIVVVAWFWLGKPRPGKAALLGIAAASIFVHAGGIWAIAPALVGSILAQIGVQ